MAADIRIFRSQLSVRRQENAGGLPPLVIVGALRYFRNASFMIIWSPCMTNRRLVSVCRVNISNAIRRHRGTGLSSVRRVFHTQSNSGHIIFAVFGLLYFDAPHGVPFIVSVLPLLRKLLQFAGVILRQVNFFSNSVPRYASVISPLKVQIPFRVITRTPGHFRKH